MASDKNPFQPTTPPAGPAGQPAAGSGSGAAPGAGGAQKPGLRLDLATREKIIALLRARQSLAGGIAGGAAAALAGAVVWATVTAVTNFQIGWMAVGVGFLVGFAVLKLGKGVDSGFRVAGAGLALAGCVLGNAFAVCFLVAAKNDVSLWQVLGSPALVWRLMTITFNPMDLLFYGIAVYEGWRFSAKTYDDGELLALAKAADDFAAGGRAGPAL